MKEYKYKTILLISVIGFLLNCEAKPDKETFGFTNDDFSVALLGVLSNANMVDNSDGTITDTNFRLMWQKCSFGQVYRRTQNDCQGAVTGSVLNPQDPYRYGAKTVAFCDSRTHACNRVAPPQTLIASSEIAIVGTSEAFNACNALGNGYRVPNPAELQRLTATGRNGVLARFPSTVEGDYWSNLSEVTDFPGETAITISFDRQTFGDEKKTVKTDRNYLRCVRSY